MKELIKKKNNTKKIKYKKYKKIKEMEYYLSQQQDISALELLLHLLFFGFFAVRAILICCEKTHTTLSSMFYISTCIAIMFYYLLITEFDKNEKEYINIFAPNLFWIILLLIILVFSNNINTTAAWLIGMGGCCLLSMLKGNGKIYPLYPLLRFQISFKIKKTTKFLLTLLYTFLFLIFIFVLYQYRFI